MSTITQVRDANRVVAENTTSRFFTYNGKDIHVVERTPEYDHPAGVAIILPGLPGEQAALLTDQMEVLAEKFGLRAVVIDMPSAAGYSYDDAEIEELSPRDHMHSVEDRAGAIAAVLEHLKSEYGDTQNGPFHIIPTGDAGQAAIALVERMPEDIGSVTFIAMSLDGDLYDFSWRDIGRTVLSNPFNRASGSVYPLAANEETMEQLRGSYLTEKRQAFISADPAVNTRYAGGPYTYGYFRARESFLNEINPTRDTLSNPLNREVASWFGLSGESFAETVTRNNINVSFIGNRDNVLIGDSDKDWTERYDIPASVVDISGESATSDVGPDLLHNPEVDDQVFGAIKDNMEGCSYLLVANEIRSLSQEEWSDVPKEDIKQMQRDLESMGFSVGQYRDDGRASKGAFANTEDALTGFVLTYVDYRESATLDAQGIQGLDLSPQGLMDMVGDAKSRGFTKPAESQLRIWNQLGFDGEVTHNHINVARP